MQEAFRQAMEKNPNSPVVREIKKANQAQAAERFKNIEKRRVAVLRQQFKEAGLMWFNKQVDELTVISYGDDRIPIKRRKEKWTQALTTLKNRPHEERIDLLKALASGMQLTDDHAPGPYVQSLFQIVFDNPLDLLTGKWLVKNFTPQSILFMEAISDMSGHSKEQKQEFRDFMAKDAGLKGKVDLPQLFPGISRWIEQDTSRPSSHISSA